MRKALYIVLALAILIACLVLAARLYLPTFAFHMIGKAIGGSVSATHSSVGLHDGILSISLEGVTVKGAVMEGRIGHCELAVEPRKGLYLTDVSISDFDITVKGRAGHFAIYPVPVEKAEITKGLLVYGGKKYVVRSLKVTNFNTGKTMGFDIDAGVEGLGNLKTHGEGFFGEQHSDVKGEYDLTGVNIARILHDYEGLAGSKGSFTYKEGRLVMDGMVEAPYFSLMEKFLLKRVVSEDNKCHIHFAWADDTADVSLEGLSFRGAPLTLAFRARGKKLLDLSLTMEFLPMRCLMEYVDLVAFSEKDWAPLSYVQGGEVRIRQFVYHDGSPLFASFEVRNGSGGEGDWLFKEMEGSVRLEKGVFTLSGFRGRFAEGRISDVSGVIPLKGDRDVRIKGRYSLGLKDLGRFGSIKDVQALGGTTEGAVEISGRLSRGFSAEGSGIVTNGEFLWRTTRFNASGAYDFKNGSVSFDGLVTKGASTHLAIKGRVGAHLASIAVTGIADGRQVGQLFLRPYHPRGPIGVDGAVEVREGAFSARGKVDLTDLAFEIPRVMKKGRGVEAAASFSVGGQTHGEIAVDDLDCTMAGMEARFSGHVAEGKISHARVVLDLPQIERAGLFFFKQIGLQGDVKADLSMDEVRLDLAQLPAVRGSLSLNRGSLHLPWMANPLTNIDLSCKFADDRLDLDVSGLTVGGSRLASGRLRVTGLETPTFSLSLLMDRFDLFDFTSREKRKLRIPVIPDASILSRARGTILLKAREIGGTSIAGRDLTIDAAYADRTVKVDEGAMAMSPGSVSFKGSLRLAQKPEMSVTGDLSDLTAQEAFGLFGAGSESILEGTGSISGFLTMKGRDAEELAKSAEGEVRIASRNGTIRKWRLISKLLAVTNLYDLFRGRVDLTKGGLAYRRLGASFEGKNGIFHTSNFFIDSPSMIITGAGDLNGAAKTIDGKMTVSPLVTMDRLIAWLPLLKDIMREKKAGFIFFVYDVKGPFSDPDIRSSYVQSVGKRAFNILWNTLKLPKEIVDELPKELFPKELFEQ